MQTPGFDPGLTQQFTAPFRRVIAKDGGFNVLRKGGSWRDVHPYLHLINVSWPLFLSWVLLAYLLVNTLFACAYYAIGPGQLAGDEVAASRFLTGFFFSAHTLTTVGYGSIAPKGLAANVVAVVESMAGVLGFAIATGLLFGRVSRPTAKIGFSETMLIAPYQDGDSLQFRVANRRPNELMEVGARVMLMTVETRDGRSTRQYQQLKLERDQVLFLALTWTIVHPIDSESPLYRLTAEDLKRKQAEVVILLKGFDDTFSQTVFSRYSYRHEEIQWGKRFVPAFFVTEEGDMQLNLDKIGEITDAVT